MFRFTATRLLKALFALAFSYYLYSSAQSGAMGNFIDAVDLIIHEAGHTIFSFFNRFIYILGGSLTQVLVPLIFMIYFFFQRQYYSGFFILMWVGYNLISVSIYMADAINMNLPLLGGESVIHDWNYLLGEMSLLNSTYTLSSAIYNVGFVLMAVGLIFCITLSFKDVDTTNKGL